MVGTAPELTPAVPCPGLTRICTGIVCYCQLALLTSSQLIVLGQAPSSYCITSRWRMSRFCWYIHWMNMPESLFFIFFLQRLLEFGVLRVARIVRLIQAKPISSSYSLYRCFESLLVGDAGKTPNLASGNQEQKVKECSAVTNWTKWNLRSKLTAQKLKTWHDIIDYRYWKPEIKIFSVTQIQ